MRAEDKFFLFCNLQQVNAGNALASVWDCDSGGGDTFGNVRLSPTGQEPATHLGASSAVDDEMKHGITNAITQGTPWLNGYKQSDGYTFESALVGAGLIIIKTPLPVT